MLVAATVPALADSITISVPANISQTVDEPFPYLFPNGYSAETPELFPMPQCHGVTLEEATIDQLQDYMSQGILSSVKLALCYLERICKS